MNKTLEEFMKEEGWVKKKYYNCGVPYFAWHKDGFQIDGEGIDGIEPCREWEDA